MPNTKLKGFCDLKVMAGLATLTDYSLYPQDLVYILQASLGEHSPKAIVRTCKAPKQRCIFKMWAC